MNNFRRLIVIVGISLLLLACSGGSDPESEAKSSSGSSSSASAVPDGYPFMGVAELDAYLAENSGKPTMVLFWTTWCPSCKEEMPEMEKLRKSHGDKLNVITISLDEQKSALEAYFSKNKLDLPVYHGDEAIARKFEIQAIPTLVIFDKDGTQTFAKAGIFPHSMLESMADKLIGQ